MRRRKRRKRNSIRNLIITIIILVAALCLLWIIMLGMYGKEDEGEAVAPDTEAPIEDPGTSGEASEPGEAAEPGGEAVTPQETGTALPPYFDEGRAERYEAFAAMNPELAFDDVVWRVNVDLDREPYEDPSEVKDPSGIQALVTKFFKLPSDYSPQNLVNIDNSMMRAEAAEAMNEMIDMAGGEGHHLWVQSGYRSYSTQAGLHEQYVAADGQEAADRYSARAGHSEHQTGLVADLNTISDAFGDTPEGKWAIANSWYFGFIVRYTEENRDVTLFKYEPWHMRYIGREAAETMHDLGIQSFEEYWVKYVNH